jgi:hypothetical protein
LYQQLPKIVASIHVKNIDPTMKGRIFEDEVIKRLQGMKFDPWKAPGRRIMIHGLSCVEHEQDIPFVRRFSKDPIYFVENKWKETGFIEKDHILTFNQKVLDIYFKGYIDSLKIGKLYRIFIASRPLTVSAFKMCLTHGMLVLEPTRPPIDWAIVTLERRLKKGQADIDKFYLLSRLKSFRKKIFRECSSFPNPNVHKGDILLQEYRSLIWEVDPTKIVM